ncbi:MAG: hypothetical protein ACYCZF_10215 [Anaerolineae bacterium]
MKPSLRFSLIVFAPVFAALIVPSLWLLPTGILLTLIAIADPTLPLSGAISFDLWIIGPLIAAFILFLAGIWLHSLYCNERSRLFTWIVTWTVFTAVLFLAVWLGVTILTSLGASETPIRIFLSFTAMVAAVATLLMQAVVIAWLYIASRILRRVMSKVTGETPPIASTEKTGADETAA